MMDTRSLLRDMPKGEVTVKDDRMQVVFRRRYAKPVAKVWAALTKETRTNNCYDFCGEGLAHVRRLRKKRFS
jgi:hypothetical protein